MLVSFACPWNSFCSPWGAFGPFGSLWGALGFKGALLGVSWASLWLPWYSVGPFGTPWTPKWSLTDFGSKMDVRFRHYLKRLRCLRIKSNHVEFSPLHIHAKWRKSGSSNPHFTRAGG